MSFEDAGFAFDPEWRLGASFEELLNSVADLSSC